MRARATAALVIAFAAALPALPAFAQSHPFARPMPPPHAAQVRATAAGSSGLRSHFGLDAVGRLLQSTDPGERLRGLERAAAIHTPEALALLERAASPATPGSFDPHAPNEGVARKDPRGTLVVVRALASWIDQESAREALAGILGAQTQSFATQVATSDDPVFQDEVGSARIRLAREEAAMALAASGHSLALEGLLAAARSGGPAQEPALRALAASPPAPPLLGGVVLTTPAMIALASTTGDLRAIDAIEGALKASDATLRAAAFASLGLAADARIRPAARAALEDRDSRVRIAAADALGRLGAPEAESAVERLIADDVTARDGLRLAEGVQGAGIVRAAAARVAASSDDRTRSSALIALGRQADPLAVEALAALVGDANLAGDAADALAHSPSRAAMPAIERLAAADATRRLALRAYFVRREVRQERSDALEARLAIATTVADPRDRAVAVEARVALGQMAVAKGLADPDPRVQRAAAMGALGLPAAERHRAYAAGLPAVADEAARRVLTYMYADADEGALSTAPALATVDLLARAQAGAVDAPLAAMAFSRRADDTASAEVDDLLASADAVLRAHAARGLGASRSRSATGRLCDAYAFEADVDVRRALIGALAVRTGEAEVPARRETLAFAERLDPDGIVRAMAARARSDAEPAGATVMHQVAWIRLRPAEGAALPQGTTAIVTGSDGLARPVVFDDEGYALIPGLPPGEARLRLASRVTAYKSP